MTDDGVHLIVNAMEQRALRQIRRLRQSGLSARAIIAELERRQVTPKVAVSGAAQGGAGHVRPGPLMFRRWFWLECVIYCA